MHWLGQTRYIITIFTICVYNIIPQQTQNDQSNMLEMLERRKLCNVYAFVSEFVFVCTDYQYNIIISL